jgi:transposase
MDRKTLAPTAAAQHGTALLAIELACRKWKVGVRRPGEANARIRDYEAGAVPRLLEWIADLRSAGVDVVACYEAGRDGFWLQRALAQAGVRCHVIDPSSLQVTRRRRQAKTDRIDVHKLLNALGRWLGGDGEACRMVRVPTPAQEDAKRGHRERRRLIGERVRLVNAVKSLLALHGIRDFDPLRRERHARLAVLRTALGEPLPPTLAGELERALRRLDLVLEQLATVETARDAAVAQPAAEDAGAAKIALLTRLKSIGVETATGIYREALYRDFANRRQVASYVGLAGTPWQSGDSEQEQGISKAGNARARTTMIELAWLWLHYQPQSALSRWFHAYVGGGGRRRLRKLAIVALARRLLVALWRYLNTGIVPAGAVLKP